LLAQFAAGAGRVNEAASVVTAPGLEPAGSWCQFFVLGRGQP